MVLVSDAVTAPSIVVECLTIRARQRTIIDQLSFAVSAGTLLWITGENGAGKSSLLRALALRSDATGRLRMVPAAALTDIAFYAPRMSVPGHTTVGDWLAFNRHLHPTDAPALAEDHALVPNVSAAARLDALSTGEAKRLVLWSLLRIAKPFTFLDEPYEHLSPAAKGILTDILVERAKSSVVVVATNQDVPDVAAMEVLDL